MKHLSTPMRLTAAILLLSNVLSGCNDSSSSRNGSPPQPQQPNVGQPGTEQPDESIGRTFTIQPGDDASTTMAVAMVQAAPGDTIEFGCGYFELAQTLQIINNEDITIKGCGKDQTVLSFKNNNAPEGILGVNVHGLWIEDLTVLDTGGNGIELRGVNHATLKRVRTLWSSGGGRESDDPITADNAFENNAARLHVACTDPATQDPTAFENGLGDTTSPDYTVSPKSGRYGIYPVSSENILIEEAESVGASDAGIYVGQTSTAIIRNSRAAFNVFGFEIENVRGGEYDSNLAECNTGGFLVYDLDGLRQYGDRTRMFNNISRNNNTYNFTSGGFVGDVPPGSGMITLAYDNIEVFDNVFENNNTAGIIHVSYEIFPEGAGRPSEKRIDFYTEGLHIYRNTFRNNGNNLPTPTSNDLQEQTLARLLPPLVGLKNQAACLNPANAATCLRNGGTGYRGAHIIWDGLLDDLDPSCPYPNGVPADERGKPLYNNTHKVSCRYNAYKFNAQKERIVPDWFASCIANNNLFENGSLTFANFKGTKGLEAVIAAATAKEPKDPQTGEAFFTHILGGLTATDLENFASDFDISAHKCPDAYGTTLEPLPRVVIPPYVPSGKFAPAPSEAEVRALCESGVDGQVNFAAALRVNCPTLDQYHLFADAEEPRSTLNSNGVPFVLTTKLFSDYTVKYRALFLPPGTSAQYRDSSESASQKGYNITFDFPVGTILSKTFAAADETADTERPIETRLIIKRQRPDGQVYWVGLPYLWQEEDGRKVARLKLEGSTEAISWNTTDVDSGVVHSGSTNNYLVPNANQCLSCHGREEGEPGAVPIGLKARFLNKPFYPESGFVSETHPVVGNNQIAWWCANGILTGCPSNLSVNPQTQIANVERIPAFNKPGDSGHSANSAQDIEARARAWLEVNCQHCHNVSGFASNTGFYLNALPSLATYENYGICKKPTATGQEGSGGRTFDIHPTNALDSIVAFRIGPDAESAAARMPPLGRSVVDEEAAALISNWINNVVVKDKSRYHNADGCDGPDETGLPFAANP
ncbi:parallel beta-helix domain-containing protein [Litorivivens sp.]|uniref:parallel beta-helix domain-containing protein n=1 Tax=Litorivivens sp. TaxID=2020868 RepID=UPI003565BC10